MLVSIVKLVNEDNLDEVGSKVIVMKQMQVTNWVWRRIHEMIHERIHEIKYYLYPNLL